MTAWQVAFDSWVYLFLMAVGDIRSGEEMLINYGESYWTPHAERMRALTEDSYQGIKILGDLAKQGAADSQKLVHEKEKLEMKLAEMGKDFEVWREMVHLKSLID